MTKEKQFARAKAIAVLECMAIDLTGSLAGLKEANPMTEVLNQRLDAIDVAQEALRGQPRWIPADERLPEVETTVLLVCKNGARFCGFYRFDYEGEVRWKIWTALGSARYLSKGRVTHWMPLPEPPEVEV